MDRRVTRAQLRKLTRRSSTKGERRIAEILKVHKIPFRAKARVGRYEIDFLIGRVALEVDGSVHDKINPVRDSFLFNEGYVPTHIRSDSKKSTIVVDELLRIIRNNNDYTSTTRPRPES